MTVQELYAEIGGNYKMLLAVLKTEERIQKYLKLYVNDTYYPSLCAAVEQGDPVQAFEAAHGLKGVTGMLYLTGLYDAVNLLVEQLRPQNAPVDMKLFRRVQEEQEKVVEAIQRTIG